MFVHPFASLLHAFGILSNNRIPVWPFKYILINNQISLVYLSYFRSSLTSIEYCFDLGAYCIQLRISKVSLYQKEKTSEIESKWGNGIYEHGSIGMFWKYGNIFYCREYPRFIWLENNFFFGKLLGKGKAFNYWKDAFQIAKVNILQNLLALVLRTYRNYFNLQKYFSFRYPFEAFLKNF